MNTEVCGLKVDTLWEDARLIAELDGRAAHERAAFVHRDRERDLVLRRAGYRVVRYSWAQVTSQASRVAADLIAHLRC